jgi:nucleoredoxin
MYEEYFGEHLLRGSETVGTCEALAGKVIGIYFSAHWCPPCRGFTPKLAEFYKKLKKAGKNFEIIFASSDRDEKAFNEYYGEMPWLALPFSDRERKNALSKKFKVSGIPTFVLFNEDGTVNTTKARQIVSDDPEGNDFPWKPKTFSELIGDEFVRNNGDKVSFVDLKGKTLGLYFSAHWCPPCRGFTPDLIKTYNKLKERGEEFEIIFASSDSDDAAFKEYFDEMPWLAIPYSDRKRKESLSSHFDVSGIPTFVMIDKDGSVITSDGRSGVSADPDGKEFPWYPKPVNDLSAGPGDINESTSFILLTEDDSIPDKDALNEKFTEYGTKSVEAKEDICYFTAKSDSQIASSLRRMTKVSAKDKAQLLILDIPDDGGYYVYDGDVTADSFASFFL